MILLFSISLVGCKTSKTFTNIVEVPFEESNILTEFPSFSLDYNKTPSGNIETVVDSGQLVFPHLINSSNCEAPLTEITFSKAIDLIEKETSSIDKIELIKKVVGNNCLTTFQIKRLGDFFTSELYKLKHFEFAYPFCYDQQNYFILEKEFVLENNKEKFRAILK